MASKDSSSEFDARDEDTMKILLATDIHLGYEDSTKRLQENDSFITFEEILQHAQKHEVDFILLGGDLFHDCKPTQKIIVQCIELLRKYVMGARPINVSFLTKPEDIFPHSSQEGPNFEDENMNVALPIFSIHGNHDNPSFESTGSMDILQASGLVNYFGKWPDFTNINIPPMVFNKGETYVSIYGLSYVNDQRLSRLLRNDQITLLRAVGAKDPFNIFVMHQNRSKHTRNGYIPENELPAGIDLVFWGHEHECRVHPESIVNTAMKPERRYHITQPGSSVATSLCLGESQEKHIGLLKVNRKRFIIEPIKLETVRPLVFEDLHLHTVDLPKDFRKTPSALVEAHVDEYIEHILLPKAAELITDNPDQPKVPLIRLRVFYTDDSQVFDVIRLARKYAETVANPRDMILFRKEKAWLEDDKKNVFGVENDDDDNDMSECFHTNDDDDWTRTVQGGIRNYFARENKKNLKILSVGGLNEALRSFVETGDDDAFKKVTKHQIDKALAHMKSIDVEGEDEILEQLKLYKDQRNKTEEDGDGDSEVLQYLKTEAGKSRKKPTQSKTTARDASDEEPCEDSEDEASTSTRGRGRGTRGRARGTRGTSRGRGKASKPALDVSHSSYAPKANSTMKPTNKTSFSNFGSNRSTAATREKCINISDSD